MMRLMILKKEMLKKKLILCIKSENRKDLIIGDASQCVVIRRHFEDVINHSFFLSILNVNMLMKP